MTLIITPAYAGLLAILYFYLTLRVVMRRRGRRISIGTERAGKEDRDLLRATRTRGNFAEYAPFNLLLIGFAELMGAWPGLVHLLALTLLIGRVIHAIGLAREPDILPARIWGMYLTAAAMLGAALTCLVLSVSFWI